MIFNIDLLQYESNTFSNDFINLLTSHSLLPSILQPTRVTDHSSTIIDNIFSNASDSGESVSGNITTNISDHFIQFMLIKNITSHTKLVIILFMTTLNLAKKNLFTIFLY